MMSKTINRSRTPIYRALKQYRLALLATTGLTAGAAAEQPQHTEWECRPQAEGGWQCVEKEVVGRAFQRPQHQAATVAAEAAETADKQGRGLTPARNLDWVEAAAMTDQQRKRMATGCCGAYIQPPQDADDIDRDPALAPLDINADSTDAKGDIATLTGDVRVEQGYRRLRSDRAVINQRVRSVDLEGNVQLREPNVLLLGDTAHIDTGSKAADLDNATFVFHDKNIRGTATHLNRTPDNHLIIDKATYTSCPPDSNAWRLVASSVNVDGDTDTATARNVRLHIKDVPVLYFPWLRFPVGNTRKSGILYPHFEVGEENGVDVALPYYLNLAPNYDATLTPRYIAQRGTMLGTELRHLSSWSYTTLETTFLSDDKGGNEQNVTIDPETGLKPLEGEDRWLVNLEHNGRIGAFYTTIDYTQVSDSLYFRHFDNSTLEVNSRTHLLQRVATGFTLPHWDIDLRADRYQTIFEKFEEFDENNQPIRKVVKPYKQLPRLDINGNYDLAGSLVLTLNNHIANFDHSDNHVLNSGRDFSKDVNNTFITGRRARLDWGLEWNNHWAWGFMASAVKARHIRYQLDDAVGIGNGNESPSVTAPLAYLDSGLFFERDTTLLSGFTQTLEPRMRLLYSKFEEQGELPDFDTSELTFSYSSLWRDDRFSGGDRIGDTQQVSVGLTTRLLDDLSGIEWLRASVGQIFYVKDRQVSLNTLLTPAVIENPLLLDSNGNGVVDVDDSGVNERTVNELAMLTSGESPIAADMTIRLGANLKLITDAIWNTSDSRIDKGSFALRYNNRDNAIFNLGYRFTRRTARPNPDPTNPQPFLEQDIEQSDISTIFPLVGNLSLIARWNYDLTNKRDLETFAGVEYNSCCWRASLVARRWIDRDDLRFLPEESLQEDDGIFFQIQFKGLAGTSDKVDSILSDGIYGYKPEEN